MNHGMGGPNTHGHVMSWRMKGPQWQEEFDSTVVPFVQVLRIIPWVMRKIDKKLDDGWPESVEEQGLLLLVWRRNFRNDVWKMCYRQSRRGVSRPNSEKLLHTVAFTQTLLHRKFLPTEAFTYRSFYTDTFTHRYVYTQTLLHTDPFTHRSCFYTQMLVHTEAFTHRRFYTQALLHTNTFTQKLFYTQTLLHADAFTHRRFYTQRLLHTNTFTHKHFYTQTLLHTDAFTHRRSDTQTLLHGHFYT